MVARLVRSIVLGAAATLLAQTACAAPILSVMPTAAQVGIGSTFSLDIRITGVTDLFAFGVDVDFGPGPVKIAGLSASEGTFLGSGGGGTTFAHGGFDNVNGTLSSVVAALSGIGPTASGAGTLATIVFVAVALGSTNIVLSNIQLLDSTLTQIDFDTPLAGQVRVSAVPEPATLLLAAIGAAAVARRHRYAPKA